MRVLGRPDILDLSSQLRAAAGQLIRRLRNETGTSLSWSQSALLSALSRQPSATASQLAADNGLRTQTVWATIDTLVAAGLAVRARDPEDRRNVRVTLTQAGLDELVRDRQVRECWIVDVLTHEFTADERSTLAAAIPLIDRLARSGRTTNNIGRRTDARL
jgi:DNA-binding MarR family transcriptional regulator